MLLPIALAAQQLGISQRCIKAAINAGLLRVHPLHPNRISIFELERYAKIGMSDNEESQYTESDFSPERKPLDGSGSNRRYPKSRLR